MINMIPLEGENVRLLPIHKSHVNELFEISTDQLIWTYMFMKIETIDDVHKMVEESLTSEQNGVEFTYVIIDKETGKIVGSTRLYDYSKAHKQIEIGSTWLTPQYWGTSINKAATYLLLQYCFEELGLIRVQFKVDLRNIRSQKAIESLGATKEGILRKHRILPTDGFIRDTVIYSVINDEWALIRERLENILYTK